MGEEPERSALTTLISVPGLAAVAILGVAAAAMVPLALLIGSGILAFSVVRRS